MPSPTRNDDVVLRYAALAGLSSLIPLPYLDSYAKERLMRRLVGRLAAAHGLALEQAAVEELARDAPTSPLAGVAKRVALTPLKFVMRKAMFILSGKRVLELATETYHRGWLLDRCFAHRWCAPAGQRSAAEVRSAIEEVLRAVPVASSPITEALKVGFERSRSLLADLAKRSRAAFSMLAREEGDTSIHEPREGDDDRDPLLDRLIRQLARALTEVPQQHFDDLFRRLETILKP